MIENIDERLYELAETQDRVGKRVAQLKAERAQAYETYIQRYDDEIDLLEKALADFDRRLRDDLIVYMTETGDLHLHPAVTFRRTTKLLYDKREVVRELIARNETAYLRWELNVRPFEAAIRRGKLDSVLVESVPAPTIAFGKLGDLLITADHRDRR